MRVIGKTLLKTRLFTECPTGVRQALQDPRRIDVGDLAVDAPVFQIIKHDDFIRYGASNKGARLFHVKHAVTIFQDGFPPARGVLRYKIHSMFPIFRGARRSHWHSGTYGFMWCYHQSNIRAY